jgi:transcriptional regulator with XRE-family HTH domain
MGWTRRDIAATFQRMLQDRYRRAGDEVRRLRLARGLSQEELAHRAGMSTKTVARIEKGSDHEHRGSTYRRLAEALDVPPERLLGIIFSEDDDEPHGLMSGHSDADTNSR